MGSGDLDLNCRTALLDAAAQARLRALDPDGRGGVVRRVMRTFESMLQRSLLASERALASADHAEIGRIAHTLKSASASVGALALARCCAEVEALAFAHTKGDIDAAAASLLLEGQAALAAVRDMLRR